MQKGGFSRCDVPFNTCITDRSCGWTRASAGLMLKSVPAIHPRTFNKLIKKEEDG